MNSKTLTEQLINNLKAAVEAKKIARSPMQLADDIGRAIMNMGEFKHESSIEEGWIGTTCHISLPGYLGRIAQMINQGDHIIEINPTGLTPIESYLKQIDSKRDKVEAQIDRIMTNQKLVLFDGIKTTPISELLEKELKYVESEVKRVEACHKVLLQKRLK